MGEVPRHLQPVSCHRTAVSAPLSAQLVTLMAPAHSPGIFVSAPLIPLVIVLVAFAYLEEDGVLLCLTLAIILVLLMIAGGVAWQGMSTTGWVTVGAPGSCS